MHDCVCQIARYKLRYITPTMRPGLSSREASGVTAQNWGVGSVVAEAFARQQQQVVLTPFDHNWVLRLRF